MRQSLRVDKVLHRLCSLFIYSEYLALPTVYGVGTTLSMSNHPISYFLFPSVLKGYLWMFDSMEVWTKMKIFKNK